MAQQVPTQFEKFVFDKHERFVLTPTQIQHIKTEITEDFERRLALTVDPTNTLQFVQAEAYLKGRIEFGQYLLTRSEASLTNLSEDNPGE